MAARRGETVKGAKARLARKIAYSEAKRYNLWDKGIMPKPSLWQRIAIAMTPWKRKAREAIALDRKGLWYKWAIKRITVQVKSALTDRVRIRELESFNRARVKIKRKHERNKGRVKSSAAP
jgi:predicted metalloendopeptidase